MMKPDDIAYVRYLRDWSKRCLSASWYESRSERESNQHLRDYTWYRKRAIAECERRGGHRFRHDGARRSHDYKHCRYCGTTVWRGTSLGMPVKPREVRTRMSADAVVRECRRITLESMP